MSPCRGRNAAGTGSGRRSGRRCDGRLGRHLCLSVVARTGTALVAVSTAHLRKAAHSNWVRIFSTLPGDALPCAGRERLCRYSRAVAGLLPPADAEPHQSHCTVRVADSVQCGGCPHEVGFPDAAQPDEPQCGGPDVRLVDIVVAGPQLASAILRELGSVTGLVGLIEQQEASTGTCRGNSGQYRGWPRACPYRVTRPPRCVNPGTVHPMALSGDTVTSAARAAPTRGAPARDLRRWLQLALAGMWVLDGLLQYQPFMFTAGFAKTLTVTAQGNPRVIAAPITWAAGVVAAHPVWTNAVFATVQLLVGLGIAWRPTVRVALAGSMVWAVAVWWFGEGLGGVLAGTPNPISGAPGAVVVYALLAVLLWPVACAPDGAGQWSFVAARPVGVLLAQALWLVLWGALALFAVLPANRSRQGLHDVITGMTGGQPRWLVGVVNAAADLVAGRGEVVSIGLGVVLAVIAVGVFLPAPSTRIVLGLAVVLALLIWVVGEALGNLFSRQGTDPNSGPLLVLLALAYWPLRQSPATSPVRPDERLD